MRGAPPEAIRETVTVSVGAVHVLKNAADRLREHMDVKSADHLKVNAAGRSLSRVGNGQLAENAARITPGHRLKHMHHLPPWDGSNAGLLPPDSSRGQGKASFPGDEA